MRSSAASPNWKPSWRRSADTIPMSATVHAQIRVRGQVQGVGFRPFVYRLAHELGLSGWVRNDAEGVEIALEGAQPQVTELLRRLRSESPALARVENILFDLAQPPSGLRGFSIETSRGGRSQTGIAPDAAVCPDCLAEMFDPHDRRYRYPFINCIHCGPRYTLTARLPYDRVHTSMAAFVQCPDCQNEYDHPGNRRFHAQPNACSVCGPQLRLYDADWQPMTGDDPVTAVATRLQAGEVVAVKGLGGFHLTCDACNAAPVSRLRGGKRREEKPFAVMLLNVASARRYAEISEDEAALLQSGERPIVLLRKRADCDEALPGIAPDLSQIGVMLPYAPLHYLLFHELLGRPAGTSWLKGSAETALVMTSANHGGEPLVKDDAEARAHLSDLADAYLTHDRGILHRCDDSVMRWQGGAPAFVRRARGFVPHRIALPFSGPSVLACGAWLKNTVCVTRGHEAFVSQHIGDLDHAGARHMLEGTVEHLCGILDVQPQAVAHDMHPDFFSTQFAQTYAVRRGLPVFPVQHHHAHIATVCADHGVNGPVLGLALDGVGLGTDGTPWGGELLLVEGAAMQRLGHLAPMAMPGGDQAARAPWRMAAAALHAMGRNDEIARRFPSQAGAATVAAMLQRRLNCTATSSMGRLFDTAAGLLGVLEIQSYEGQAAMRLEGMAERHGAAVPLAGGYTITPSPVLGRSSNCLDFGSLLAALAECGDATYGAALFHATLVDGLSAWVMHAARKHNIDVIALGGGCFLNNVLTQALTTKLAGYGLRVIAARQVPPSDGGLALGQAWVAIHQLSQGAR